MKSERQYSVLIADDSETDRFLLKRAIKTVSPRLNVVQEMTNGDDAIAYLSGKGTYADREHHPFPDLLVLDSRMPGKGGIEVLEWLRTCDFPQLKVAFLADSSATTLKRRALELGANFFFAKAVRTEEVLRIARTLQAELERGTGRKVLLRHKNTQCYFQSMCRWSPLHEQALEFDSFERAVHYAHEHHLTNDVQVVLVFIESGQTFSFPFPSQSKTPAN